MLKAFPLLEPLLHKRASTLSGGQQQATSIGRALMTNPRLLLIDEVSLGLAPVAVDLVYESLSSLIDEGATIILVEQDLHRALSVSRRVACMLEGRVVLTADTASVSREQVTEAYIGVMRIINLAHGDIAVLGAFLVWQIAVSTGLPPLLALLPALPVMLILGYLLQRTVLARSLRSGPLTPLLTTFGLAIVLQNAMLQVFSPDVRSLGSLAGTLSTGSWQLTSQLSIPYLGSLILAVAVLVLGGRGRSITVRRAHA